MPDCNCASQLPERLNGLLEGARTLMRQRPWEDIAAAVRAGNIDAATNLLEQQDQDDCTLLLLALLYDTIRPTQPAQPDRQADAVQAALRAERDHMRTRLEEASAKVQPLESAFNTLKMAHTKLQQDNAALKEVVRQLSKLL